MTTRFVLRADDELQDLAQASRLETPRERLAKGLTTAERGVPSLTDAEAQAALRSWIRTRARRWVRNGYDWTLPDSEQTIESRADLVTQIHDCLLQLRTGDVPMHQAVRSLGEGLLGVIESEVGSLVAADLDPDWLKAKRAIIAEQQKLKEQEERQRQQN